MSNFRFNIGTSVNGMPNYNVGMDVDGGLLDQARGAWQDVTANQSAAQQAGFNPARAHTQQVQGDQLMSNQMNSLLGQNSAYLDRARQEGMNMASRRGLSNSSIAAANSMGAAIDRAAPIAQFDANRFGSVADQNMQARNQVGLANMQTGANVSMANAQAANTRANAADQMFLGHQFGALDDYRRSALGIEQREDDQAFRAGQADIDRFINQDQFYRNYGLSRDQFEDGSQLNWARHGLDETRLGEDINQAEWNRRFQDRQLDGQLYQGSMGQFFTALSNIYSNPNLTAEQQSAAVANLRAMYPGISNEAFQAIPEGMFAPQAVEAAQMLPPMRRFRP